MPDNSIITEELARAINSNYDKQIESINTLILKLERAQKNGESQEVIDTMSREIERLNRLIIIQNSNATNYYEKMVKLAGGRKDLDEKMLRDVYKKNFEYVELTKKLRSIQAQKDSELHKKGANGHLIPPNKDEIRRLNKEERETRAQRSNILKYIENEYGKDSYAAKSIRSTINSKRIQADIEAQIDESEKGQVSNIKEITRVQEKNLRQLQEAQQKWNLIKGAAKDVWAQIKQGANLWLKYNAQAIADAKRLGMTSKEEAMGYMNTLIENSKTLSRNFGMTAEQAMKMQNAYVQVTGRAALLTESQMEDIAAASKLMGDETVQNAMGIMDNMGSTSQTAIELMDKNYARALNSGLDTVKASQEFVKNMSLANKLNFRNGIDGISKMTILSQRIRMNLNEVANVAEKFSTIEGAIEGSARLQVLGGAGALYGSNPMQMMYEALSDPEALFERMKDMFGKQAVFDRRTGESRIDPIQMQIMKEQAKAIGASPEEMIQSAKHQAKLNAIEGDFRKYNPGAFNAATDEEKTAVANKAQYDKETGTWKIKYMDSFGEAKEVSVQNITEKELKEITKDNIDQVEDIRKHVRKIASELIGTKERWESMKSQWRTGIAQMIGGPMEKIDTFLTAINNSGAWKLITSGGVATGAAMLGLTSYRVGSAFLASKAERAIIQRLISGGGAVNATKTLSNASKTIKTAQIGGSMSTAVGGSASRVVPFSVARNIVKAKNATKVIGPAVKGLSKVAGAATILADVLLPMYDYYQAGNNRGIKEDLIQQKENRINNITQGRRFSQNEIQQQRIEADNEESIEKSKAIGAGVGAVIGTTIGALVGGVPGAMIGSMVGNWAGGAIGKWAAPEKEGDTIAEHLKDINDSSSKENFRRIVLPVESIDYNVSLIANQLGILSATPARNNVYLNAESNGDILVESTPLEASRVNNVDSSVLRTSDMYQPKGPITLNVNGSIDLNMKGANVGKLTAKDFKDMFDSNPELRRYIIESISKGIAANGNGAREFKELSQNRLNSQGSINFVS